MISGIFMVISGETPKLAGTTLVGNSFGFIRFEVGKCDVNRFALIRYSVILESQLFKTNLIVGNKIYLNIVEMEWKYN